MPVIPENMINYPVNKVGMAGINSFDDPKDIDDTECTDMLNMVFDNGILTPRQGTLLYAAKPEGETANPFQFLTPTNSSGDDFMIVNYGVNFYLRYAGMWVMLNQTYTPPSSGLYYGSTSWNNGIIDDRFYFGNGFDDTMKWIMAVTTVTTATPAGSLFIVVDDTTTFPSTGPIIIQNPSGSFFAGTYTSKGSNSLEIDSSVDIELGAVVTMQIQDLGSEFPKGKVLAKFQNRLVLANSYKAENTLNYSVLGDPETYTVSTDDTSGGFYVLYKGRGGIINIDDFGEYLVVEKQDIMLSFSFQYASDNSGFIVQVTPIISGDSVGPVSNSNSVNYMNTLNYVTESEGIVAFSPVTTGSQTSPTLSVLSQKIQNYVTGTLDFSNGRSAGFDQKLFWVTATPLLNNLQNSVNNGVIMYDLLRSAWTRFDNWNAADLKPVNEVLYYISLNDGAVYECNVDYQDAQGGNPYAYNASFTTKRFDNQEPQLLSKGGYVYMQGYINPTTDFYIDVLYNENGYLGKQTYQIIGENINLVENNLFGGLGEFAFAIPLLGGLNLAMTQSKEQPAFFRAYLELSQAFRYSNIQVKCYSQDLGSYWGVNALALMFFPEASIPKQLVISPTTTPPIII